MPVEAAPAATCSPCAAMVGGARSPPRWTSPPWSSSTGEEEQRSSRPTDARRVMTKLGLIAGGGGLPLEIANACRQADRPLFVIRLKGMADPALAAFDGIDPAQGREARPECSKKAGCVAVCFAGGVKRPDFSGLVLDRHAASGRLAGVTGGGPPRRRCDAAFPARRVRRKEGFVIEGAYEVGAGWPWAWGRWAGSPHATAIAPTSTTHWPSPALSANWISAKARSWRAAWCWRSRSKAPGRHAGPLRRSAGHLRGTSSAPVGRPGQDLQTDPGTPRRHADHRGRDGDGRRPTRAGRHCRRGRRSAGRDRQAVTQRRHDLGLFIFVVRRPAEAGRAS